jgi:hypothetical protein
MKKPCLTPNCKGKYRGRGLCGSCYATAARLVSLGRTTWDKLIAEGKATGTNGMKRRGELEAHFLGK